MPTSGSINSRWRSSSESADVGRDAFLGVDVGTSGVKALLVAPDGATLASATTPLTLQTPRPGWAEQDPEAWWGATIASIQRVLAAAPRASVIAIGVSGQMHSSVFVDGGGSVVRPPNRPPPKRLPVGGPSTSGRSVLGADGTLRPRSSAVKWVPIPKSRTLRSFRYTQREFASRRVCSRREGPWFRRAGCAFVHLPG